jgi:hypothetical protein
MLAFLETDLTVDASGLNIGGSSNNSLAVPITIDQRSTLAALTSFTATVPNNADATVPFTLSVTKLDTQYCTLNIIFNQPIANVHFNELRVITIHGSNGDTFTINITINYASTFTSANWTNSDETLAIDDIDLRGALTSKSINNMFRALLSTSLTALNKAKNNAIYYYYKQRHLNDIIDFAIAGGSSFEPSSTVITYNSDGNVNSLITTYANRKLRITYNYTSYTLNRLSGADQTTPLTTESVSLLSSFLIEVLDSANAVVYTLGTVTINRSVNTYSIPYLKDYNSTLPSDQIATNPDNILSNYKYYKTNTITGWTVVA